MDRMCVLWCRPSGGEAVPPHHTKRMHNINGSMYDSARQQLFDAAKDKSSARWLLIDASARKSNFGHITAAGVRCLKVDAADGRLRSRRADLFVYFSTERRAKKQAGG